MPDPKEAARHVDAFLRAIGRDPENEPELKGTGARVAAAFLDELCVGYTQNPKAIFEADKIAGTTHLVIARRLPVATTCPHHLMQAWGEATVAFAPKKHIVGLGAIARALDACSKRLILQETIGEDLVKAMMDALEPEWAACRLSLEHGCMVARGERTHHARVETVAVAGSIARAQVDAILFGPEQTS
ncbi:MAG TPA: GTP cyclohydrolase I [Polyangiaceae bacterium]